LDGDIVDNYFLISLASFTQGRRGSLEDKGKCVIERATMRFLLSALYTEGTHYRARNLEFGNLDVHIGVQHHSSVVFKKIPRV
jgi:hypothetical protein